MADKDQKDEKDGEGEEEKPKKKLGGKLLLIIGLVGGLAIGGGTAFFLASMGGDDETAMEEQEETEAVEAEENIELFYVDINRLPAPVLDEDGKVLGYMFLDLSLETDGGENQKFIYDRLPRLQDAFLREISKTRISKPGQPGVVDYDRLRSRFLTMANKTLGRNIVRSVLIRGATQFSQ